MKTISLKKQLIKSTIITTALLGIIGFFGVSFVLIFDENNIFDDLLKANASALLNDNLTEKIDIEHGLQYLNEQMDIEYQVINADGYIIDRTFLSPNEPFLLSFSNDNYYTIYKNDKWWRVYTLYNQDKSRFIQIAQPYQQRLEFILPRIINYFLAVLIGLVILIAVNGWVIQRSLKPLGEIQTILGKKHLQELSPITPQVQLSEIAPLILAINELFARLKIASLAQERFVADASHELRTPLSAVQMKLQLLARKFGDNAALTEQLDKVKADADRAVALVENLLSLARLDNTTALAKTPVGVGDWLSEIVANYQDKFGAVRFVLVCDDKTNACTIQANVPLLTSAIGNLLDNAIRYGGDNLTVEMSAQVVGDFLKIAIKDNGIGVSDTDKARLGERFFRVLGNTATGSGLGLSIVAQIARQHGGDLAFVDGLSNADGKGFGVVLTVLLNEPIGDS